MTAPACGSCTAPVSDAYLCAGCTRELRDLLTGELGAASIAPDLDDAIAKLLKRGTGGPRSEAEAPLPIDLAASDAKRALQDELYRWCRVLRAPSWSWGTVPDMTHWLVRHLDDVRQHPRAAEMLDGIREDVNRALAVIDRQPERAPAGTCDGCGKQLLAELGADEVQCGCGALTIALMAKRRDRAAAADVLGTPAELSVVLEKLGYTVAPGTISGWGTRSQIERRAGGMYRLSEALAMAAKMGTRRARIGA